MILPYHYEYLYHYIIFLDKTVSMQVRFQLLSLTWILIRPFFFFGAPKNIFFVLIVQYLGVTAGIEPAT
jgi:hypothetical protein